MSALWRLGYDAYGRAVSWREATPTEHVHRRPSNPPMSHGERRTHP